MNTNVQWNEDLRGNTFKTIESDNKDHKAVTVKHHGYDSKKKLGDSKEIHSVAEANYSQDLDTKQQDLLPDMSGDLSLNPQPLKHSTLSSMKFWHQKEMLHVSPVKKQLIGSRSRIFNLARFDILWWRQRVSWIILSLTPRRRCIARRFWTTALKLKGAFGRTEVFGWRRTSICIWHWWWHFTRTRSSSLKRKLIQSRWSKWNFWLI